MKHSGEEVGMMGRNIVIFFSVTRNVFLVR